ncbi:MAG: hypothetical protein KA319_14825, partial [Ferruginibacter sp.]|nr:hypothetical protein [Ferruginibacter sp.]
MNSGIAGSYDRGLNEEVDIYENTFVDNFDAIECDGYWTNLRVWKNEIIRPMAGISAAPPLIGPRYFYRNVFYGMKGRRNERYDPHFIGCYPVSSNYKGQAVGIKTNSGYAGKGIRGNLYFFNNTFFSSDTLGFVFTSWAGEWKKAVFINNIFAHENSYPIFYVNIANSPINSNFQIHSVTDDYFTYNPNSVIIKAKHIHGQYNCTEVNSVDILQSTLTKLSGSPNILIQNPLQTNPNFNLTKNNMFELNNNSSLINAGTIIPGFYDYQGSKPDIGAKEKIVMQKN